MDADILKELLHEFITETSESLVRLEKDLLSYETASTDADTLNRLFRVIHTVKGSGGSLALNRIESVSHEAEQLLHLIREEHLEVSAQTVSLLLELVDALRAMLVHLQSGGEEGPESYDDLRQRLRAEWERMKAAQGKSSESVDAGEAVQEPDAETADGESEGSDDTSPELQSGDPNVEIIPPEAFAGEGEAWGLFDVTEEAPKEKKNKAAPKQKMPQSDSRVVATQEAKTPVKESTMETNGKGQPSQAEVSESSIRVEISQLDNLMALVGELVLTRNQLIQKVERLKDQGLDQSILHLDHITSELQQEMMKTRMQPIGNAWTKLPRIVRDLAKALGKEIRLEMEGSDTELDRSLIEAIKDPLLHLVRNSVDHGIETPEQRKAAGKDQRGLLFLSAYHESGQVNIDIVDDGRGIDLEKVKRKAMEQGLFTDEQLLKMSDREVLDLVFHPGLSTAEKVSNVSGRGVGMDVVRSNIERIGGSVDIHSDHGVGTSLKLKIPLTLAIIPALIVGSGGERFAISQMSLQELVRLEGDEIKEKVESLYDSRVYRLRGKIIPIVSLNEVLKITPPGGIAGTGEEAMNIVVLQSEGQAYGLIVDRIYDSEEIVVKPLSSQLKRFACFSGATIMGDGRVALILDAQGLGNLSNAFNRRRDEKRADASAETHEGAGNVIPMLLFNAGEGARMAVPLIDVNRIEEIGSSQLEHVRGDLRVQHRGRILKLIHFSKYVPGIPPLNIKDRESVSVIVFSDGTRSIGLIVNEVLDIVNEAVAMQEPSKVDFLQGSLTLGGKVTELIDVPRLMNLADPILIQQKAVNA
jgi:two-component system, chemotaxis family, sensor kinase CheA